jgi:hypothetical protein
MPLRRFGYEHLKEDLVEFRLLTTQPRSSPEDPIYVSIETHKLSDPPQYEALSYVWGDFEPNNPHVILIGEDEGLEVSPNLFYILFKLSLADKERVMWVDAVCIDQNDLAERSSQVALMRDIYDKATRTIVFLGEESLGPYWILPIIKEITWGRTWDTDEENQIRMARTQQFKNRLATTSGIKGMLSQGFYDDIANRPYWTRVWVVQEVALSRNPIIMFGDKEMPWDDFADAAWILDEIVREIFPEISTESHGLANLKTIQSIRDMSKADFRASIGELLACLRGTKSTDPRDMVYGLLGLVKMPIVANYSVSTIQNVYIRVVELGISEDGSLDIITMRRAPTSLSGLPSWVPDWSAPAVCDWSQVGDLMDGTNRLPEPLVLRYFDGDLMRLCLKVDGKETKDSEGKVLDIEPYNASVGRILSTDEVTIQRNPAALLVTGISVGTICELGKVLDREEHRGHIFFYEAFQNWEEIMLRRFGNCELKFDQRTVTIVDVVGRCYDLLERYLVDIEVDFQSEAWKVDQHRKSRENQSHTDSLVMENPSAGGINLVEALVRTIFADRDMDFQRISRDFFDEFWRSPLPSTSAWPRLIYAMTFSTHRRLFVTDNGYVGLAPMRTRENDIVCVLYGCSVPVVLREEGDEYVFIGECFVHGLMDGEAVAMQKEGLLLEKSWILL